MKLLQVGTSLGRNGIANVMRGLASQWDDDTKYAVLDPWGDQEAWAPSPLWGRRRLLEGFPLPTKLSLKRFCQSHHIEGMILHYNPLDQIAFEVAKALKIPVFYYYHNVTDLNFYEGGERLRRKHEEALMFKMLKRVDDIFCNSQFTADKIKQEIGLEAFVASPGVDVNFFCPPQGSRQDKFFRLVHLGRGVPHKGLEELLLIVHELFESRPKLRFDFVGSLAEDDYGKRCRKLLEHRQIKWWRGVNDDKVLEVLQSSHIHVSASHFEGFGMPFLEAAACGLPSLGYRVAAIPEAVAQGVSGHLVEDGDREAFKEVLKKWIEEPDLVFQLGAKARDYAYAHTWAHTAEIVRKKIGS